MLPEGSYTLQLFIYDAFSAPEPIGFGSVSFVVRPPARIPSATIPALAAICVLLVVTAALALHLTRPE